MVDDFAHCQNCENYYKPYVPEGSIPGSVPKDHFMWQRDLDSRRSKIKHQAGSFSVVAAVFVAFGVVALLFGIFGAVLGFIFSGAFFSLAIWLYMVAQIIHIRANTEK